MKAIALGVVWAALFRFNAAAFAAFAISDHASWIFLPAALRVLFPLVFRGSGVFGLVLGSLLIVPPSAQALVAPILFALGSGLAPVIGIAICQNIFKLPPDLSGLSATHLAALSLTCGAANSLIVNLCVLLTGGPTHGAIHAVTVFVGDVAGTAIVLYAIAGLLSLIAHVRRCPN
ncbi:MAG: hypothetical protein ACKOXK_11650 [Chakrabartia sp.]